MVGNQGWTDIFVTFARDASSAASSRRRRKGHHTGAQPAGAGAGLHAPFVAVSALVVFAFANAVHSSGFFAVYLAGLVVGNRQTRAHNSVIVFLDAVTWLAQIVMFVLARPAGLAGTVGRQPVRAIAVALVLMLVARPVAVFLCLAPFKLSMAREAVHFLGRLARRGRNFSGLDPRCWLECSAAYLYFDVAFVVVLLSLLVQGWTVPSPAAARHLVHTQRSRCRAARRTRPARQLAREILGYPWPPTARSCAGDLSELGAGPDAGRAQ